MNKLWVEWLALHRIFQEIQPRHFPDVGISAPFLSSDSEASDPTHKLLYVGQATSHTWYDVEFAQELASLPPAKALIAERQARNREGVCGEYWKHGFWLTFRAMSEVLGNVTGEYSHAVWSNLAKIGVSLGNPEGLLLSMQTDLASRTLQAEIAAYRPSIVVFVTGTYASSIVLSTTKTATRDWRKSADTESLQLVDDDVWWIPRSSESPAYLWTPHPSRGMSVARRAFWVDAAFQLSSGMLDLLTPAL